MTVSDERLNSIESLLEPRYPNLSGDVAMELVREIRELKAKVELLTKEKS